MKVQKTQAPSDKSYRESRSIKSFLKVGLYFLVMLGSPFILRAEEPPPPSAVISDPFRKLEDGESTPGECRIQEVSKSVALSWLDLDQCRMEVVRQGDQYSYQWKIHGKRIKDDWNVIFENAPLDVDAEGAFAISLGLDGAQTKIEVLAIGPLGEVENAAIEVEVPQFLARRPTASAPPQETAGAKGFSVGLGVASLSHTETSIPEFTQLGLNLKVGYHRALSSPREDLGASAVATLLPLARNRDEASVRTLGFNLRYGRVVTPEGAPWRLTLYGGIYFTTMTTTLRSDLQALPTFAQQQYLFGYSNVGGPQIYPTVRRELGGENFVTGYLKYSPVASGLSLLSLSNREFALGVAYGRPLPEWAISLLGREKSLAFTVDYSNLSLDLPLTSTDSVLITHSQWMLGLAVGF